MATDLSAIFASIGAAASTAGTSTTGTATYVDPQKYYGQTPGTQPSAADDQDMYDQWSNGLISDDEWLAYIAKRMNQTSGDPKEHLKWVKYQRKFSVSISDNKMKYAYEQGTITLDDYIAYQRKSLDGVSADSQEYRDRKSVLDKMVEQRSQSDIALRAQNTASAVKQGKASYDDLIGVYKEGLRSAKPGTDWYNKLQSAIAQAESDKTAEAFNGGAEEIQYLFQSGKITGSEAGKRIRSLADQYVKGDKKVYYQTLETALQYEKYGGASGASGGRGGGGGGGGGGRKQTKTTIGDAYLAKHTRALDKLNAAIKNANSGVSYDPGYMQTLRKDAIASIDLASDFIAKNGTQDQKNALIKTRKEILAQVQASNTADVQTKLDLTLAVGKAEIREAATDPKPDAGAGVIAAATKLYTDLDNLANSQPVDEQGVRQKNYVNPQVGFTQMAPDTALPNPEWLSELYGARDAIGTILDAHANGVTLSDAQIKKLASASAFLLKGKSADYSVLDSTAVSDANPELPFSSWADTIGYLTGAAQEHIAVQSGSAVIVKRLDGSYGAVDTQAVPGPVGGNGGAAPGSRIDPKKAGIGEGNILVGMLEPGADGNATLVYVEAVPATTPFAGLGQTITANTDIPLVGKDGKPLKNEDTGKQYVLKAGQVAPADVWDKVDPTMKQNLIAGESVTASDEVRLAGWYQFTGANGDAFIVNRVTGQTVAVGQEGAEVYPFTHTDNVNGMGLEGGMVNPSLAPDAKVLPIAASGLSATQVNEWTSARDQTGTALVNAGALTGTTFIDPSTGKSVTVPHSDPRVASYYADEEAYQQAQASGLGSRAGEYANGGRGSERMTVNDQTGFSVRENPTGSWAYRASDTAPTFPEIAKAYNIKGLTNDQAFGFAPNVSALMGNPQPQTPIPPSLAGAKSVQFSGPAMTGRQPAAAAPKINAATGFTIPDNEVNAQTGFTVPATPKLAVPKVALAAPSGVGKAPPPGPTLAAPNKVTQPKPKKTKVGGGSAGVKNRTVAS